jgi:hypothetical protein
MQSLRIASSLRYSLESQTIPLYLDSTLAVKDLFWACHASITFALEFAVEKLDPSMDDACVWYVSYVHGLHVYV